MTRPSPRAFFANWRGPGRARDKLTAALRNNLLKIRRRQTCCGNHGHPGC